MDYVPNDASLLHEYAPTTLKTIDLQVVRRDNLLGQPLSENEAQQEMSTLAHWFTDVAEVINIPNLGNIGEALLDKSAYLSQEHFDQSINAFAHEISSVLESDPEVSLNLFVGELTSDLFISTLVVNRLLQLNSSINIGNRLKIGLQPKDVFPVTEKSLIYILDDFIVSGNQLGANLVHMIQNFESKGLSRDKIKEMIRIRIMLAEPKIPPNPFRSPILLCSA